MHIVKDRVSQRLSAGLQMCCPRTQELVTWKLDVDLILCGAQDGGPKPYIAAGLLLHHWVLQILCDGRLVKLFTILED